MANRHTITISFLPRDDDIWQFVQTKKESCNLSEYIRNLVRKDMYSSSTDLIETDTSLELILELLSAHLPNLPLAPAEHNEQTKVSDETKSTIYSLF